MDEIVRRFNAEFVTWNITLPPEDVAGRKRGKISRSGWAIWYLFGADEKGEYLDYYASHRMTNDRHVRIYWTGEEEGLPTIGEMWLGGRTPEEDKRLEAEFLAKNERVAQLLEEKGFGIEGDEPGAIGLNRALRTGEIK
jgi:hypothetical protein